MKRLRPGQVFEFTLSREGEGYYANIRIGGARFQVYLSSAAELRGLARYILRTIGDESEAK